MSRTPFAAVEPQFAPDVDPILAELCRATSQAAGRAWAEHDREELLGSVGLGADGTPTFLLDQLVEEPLIEVARRLGVNLLSEEVGFIDLGSARTAVVDPLDGSANAAAGVPLSCFSAALVEDGRAVSALTCWLENGATVSATAGQPARSATGELHTTGRTGLDGAAISLLRPKVGPLGDSTRAWLAAVNRAARVRILSTSCLEAMLVAQGAIDAFADPCSDTHRIVDVAAAMVFVPAAGGAVVDVYGRPLEFDTDLTRRWSGVVAATPQLAEELCAELAGAVPLGLGTLPVADGELTLRRARLEDMAAVAALIDSDARSTGAGAVTDGDWRAVWRRIDRNPEVDLIVACDAAGEIVATVQYSLSQTVGYAGLLRADVEGVAVREDQRGRGLGRALIGWVVDRARRDGAGVVQLTSNLKRDRAIAFYESLGFEHSHAGMKLVLA